MQYVDKFKTITGIASVAYLALGAVATQAQEEIVFAHVFPANSLEHEAAERFAEAVGEATDGAYVVNLFPASQLGGWVEIANQERTGAINATIISTSALGGYSDLATIDSWPFLFETRDQFDAFYASELGGEFLQAIEDATGYRIIAPTYKGVRHIYARQDSDGLEGLRLRVPGLPVVVTSFESWGVSPTPMSVAEIYTAMQQGVVDGIEIEAPTAVSLGIAPITETVLATAHMMPNYGWIFWADWLDSQPQELQDAILQASIETSAWFSEQIVPAEQEALDTFAAEGAAIVEVDREALAMMSNAALREEFPELAEWVDRIQASVAD